MSEWMRLVSNVIRNSIHTIEPDNTRSRRAFSSYSEGMDRANSANIDRFIYEEFSSAVSNRTMPYDYYPSTTPYNPYNYYSSATPYNPYSGYRSNSYSMREELSWATTSKDCIVLSNLENKHEWNGIEVKISKGRYCLCFDELFVNDTEVFGYEVGLKKVETHYEPYLFDLQAGEEIDLPYGTKVSSTQDTRPNGQIGSSGLEGYSTFVTVKIEFDGDVNDVLRASDIEESELQLSQYSMDELFRDENND